MSSLREECGVFGVFSNETADLGPMAYYGLFALQHRGQESCGIVINDDGLFSSHKDVGLVNDGKPRTWKYGCGTRSLRNYGK